MVSLRNPKLLNFGYDFCVKSWSDDRNTARHQTAAIDRSGAIVACSRFVRMSLQVIMLATGGYLAILDQITPGTMIAASIIMGRALAPVEMAVAQWRNFINARDAYNIINRMVDGQPENPEVMDLPAPTGTLSLNRFLLHHRRTNGTNLIIKTYHSTLLRVLSRGLLANDFAENRPLSEQWWEFGRC